VLDGVATAASDSQYLDHSVLAVGIHQLKHQLFLLTSTTIGPVQAIL
jgi:hypothetical protein